MQYLGGKFRIAKEIVSILESIRKPGQLFIEPFVGAANIVSKMIGERHAYDIHPELINMYKSLQAGWVPPSILTNEDYEYIKNNGSDELKAFAGFGCSFSGKYFGGYARNKRGDNFAKSAANSLLRKIKTMESVKFECKDYIDINCDNALIYCDPPYEGTTGYHSGNFDSDKFWEWCRVMSSVGNTVIISEYKAPADFTCIWEVDTKTELRTKNNGREKRTEKLFI